MTLFPLLDAPRVVQVHVLFAVAALVIGPMALLRQSRDIWHKRLGRVWVGAMLGTAISSFLVSEGRIIGPFSPIHILSVFTIWGLWQGVSAARAGNIAVHRKAMTNLYVYSMGIAGVFTLLPGRRMSQTLFPDAPWAGFLGAAVGLAVIVTLLIFWPRRSQRRAGWE